MGVLIFQPDFSVIIKLTESWQFSILTNIKYYLKKMVRAYNSHTSGWETLTLFWQLMMILAAVKRWLLNRLDRPHP